MKLYREILHIALPAMVENLLQFLMGMVDSYLIAFLGLVALSGVSLANNIMAVYQAIFIALGAALSSYLAGSVGKKDNQVLSRKATEGLKLTVLLSLLLGLFSLVWGPDLLLWLGAEASVAAAGGIYLFLVGGSILTLGLMTSLGAILRATGQVRLPMYVSLLSNLLNALFSAVAVFLLDAGIAGVAWGTILARLIGGFILWRSLRLPLAKPHWGLDEKLLRLALPAAGERLMMRAGDVVVVALIVSLGTAVVAGNAVGETLTQFNYMPGLGIATATVILVARSRGNHDEKRIREVLRASYRLSLGMMFVIASIIFLFAKPLAGLYTQDSLALEASSLVMLFSFLGTPATAGTLTYTALWQGLGKAQLPFYATSLGMWLIRIGLASLLIFVCKWGLAGIWLATIMDNLFRWGFLSFLFMKTNQKRG